jgi:hypothetical protein
MSDEIRINRAPQAQQPAVAAVPTAPEEEDKKSSKLPWIILVVVVVILAVVGFLFRDKLFSKGGESKPAASSTKLSGYQAVFLTNGQVYFGKIESQNSNELVVKDIYYLQVVQPPLQGQQTASTTPAVQGQPQVSLVKLGSELHGPADEMHIYKNQVLFYEDLKDDGKVAQAIKQYQTNPTPAPVK